MLSLPGIDRKLYEVWSRGLPALGCQRCPSSTLRRMAGTVRYVDGRRLWIRRGRCPSCGVTHAILPEDVCSYRDLA